MLVARLYCYSQDYVAFCEREFGLRVGPIWFMDVVVGDEPVTTDLYENVCHAVIFSL